MTTVNTQLARMVKSLGAMEDKAHPSVIPPQLLRNTQGVIFLKKLSKGKQTANNSHGLFFVRKGALEWSQPLAVEMSQGDVYWGASPKVSQLDTMIFVQDAALVDTFKSFGQIGFDEDSPTKVKKGVCIANDEESFVKFATVLSERPDLVEGAAFSFGLCNGHFFPLHVESPVFHFRASSNNKFYNNHKGLDTTALIREGVPLREPAKARGIAHVQSFLARHFDLRARFPEYVAVPEDAEPSPQPSTASSSPNPANPSLGRLWSASTTSSNSSGGSDLDFAPGSELRWEADADDEVAAPIPGMAERVRATSFDFST